MAQVHVVYEGRTDDFEFEEIFPQDRLAAIGIPDGTVEVTAQNLTHDQVKAAAAQHYDVGLDEFEDHFVEINPNGNVTLRPKTAFGV